MYDLINQIPIADTHEHLIEESDRLNPAKPQFPNDISLLFIQYVESDLIVSGMPEDDLEILKQVDGDPEKKWGIIRRWWPVIKSTGYGQMVQNTIRKVYQIDDLNDANWLDVNAAIQKIPQSGFYTKILKNLCNLDHCQINALDTPIFRNTQSPEYFLMDLCVSSLCSDFDPDLIQNIIGHNINNLDDCIEAIDRSFRKYGNKAVAIKNQSAYRRRLDFQEVKRTDAESCLQYCLNKNWQVQKYEQKPLEDYLFNHTARKSAEYDLPYKIHTGYHSGHGTMPMDYLLYNASDMSLICRMHPDTRFVFLHITYPFQDQAIALAKHYPNAFIDMCWSWMISPVSAVRFLKEFLTTAPVNKLFAFGGDVSIVELVPGHLELAKRGVIQAISELYAEGWIDSGNIDYIIESILLKNATDLYHTDVKLTRSPTPLIS